jgi:apolipoprotein N-acyltransferase
MRLRDASIHVLTAFIAPMASGVMIGQLFSPIGCRPLAFIAIVPLGWSITTRRRHIELYAGAYLGGVIAYLFALDFLRTAAFGELQHYWCLGACLLAISWVILVAVGQRLTRITRLPCCILFPMVWLFMEYLRELFISVAITGEAITLLKLGLSQDRFTTLLQIADIFGADGLTWIVVSVNGFVVDLWTWFVNHNSHESGRCRFRNCLLGIVIPLVVTSIYACWRTSRNVNEDGPSVAIIPSQMRLDVKELMDHTKLCMDAAKSEDYSAMQSRNAWPSLFVFSETACGTIYLGRDNSEMSNDVTIDEFAIISRRLSSSLLVGVEIKDSISGGRLASNSLVFLTPKRGYAGRYDKTHLAPALEYEPALGSLIRHLAGGSWSLDPISLDQEMLREGGANTTFPLEYDDLKSSCCIGPCICFDIWFPSFFRAGRSDRRYQCLPDVYVQSANETMGFSEQFRQLSLACVRLRAVETRRPFVRSCYDGYSGIIDSAGKIVETFRAVPDNWNGMRYGVVPLDRRYSVYVHIGDVLGVMCSVVTVMILIFTFFHDRCFCATCTRNVLQWRRCRQCRADGPLT